MLMKKILIILLVLAVAGAVVFGVFRFKTRDERQIRKNIKVMGRLVSKSSQESDLALLARVANFTSYFTEDCRVVYGSPLPDMNGREDIQLVIVNVQKMFKRLEIEGVDVTVALSADHREAQTHLTISVVGSQEDKTEDLIEDRKVDLSWVKIERYWKIKEARYVPIMQWPR